MTDSTAGSSTGGAAGMTDKEWLASLKVGDEVAIWSGYYAPFVIAPVEKATAHFVDVRGVRFRREHGRRSGGPSWDRMELRQVTDEVRENVRRHAAIESFNRVADSRNIDKVPTSRIEAALALLSPEPESESNP